MTMTFIKNIIYIKRNDDLKLSVIFRFISWFITSIFYFFGEPYTSPIILKFGVIISLLISSIIIIQIHIKNKKQKKYLKLLILIETLGIVFLLIPTGGLNSPFVWLIINQILMASSLLFFVFCWLNLIFYISTAFFITYILLNLTQNSIISLIIITNNNIYKILGLVLITIVLQLILKLKSQISIKNKEYILINQKLNYVNQKYKKSIEHIMTLYQSIEILTAQNDKSNLISELLNYAVILFNSNISFFCKVKNNEFKSIFFNNKNIYKNNMYNDIEIYIKNHWTNIQKYKTLKYININNQTYLLSNIMSASDYFGLIGIHVISNNEDLIYYEKQINYFFELCKIIFERLNFQKINDQIIILEEQNRIGNEMHDKVSQLLFGIEYSSHALFQTYNNFTQDDILEQLKIISQASNSALKEIKSCIFKLSSKKKGETIFFDKIDGYLIKMSKLNKIFINFDPIGTEELLYSYQKKCLFRFICETVGNAIKHSKCENIDVNLKITSTTVELNIFDNGIGINTHDITLKNTLGINNMKNISKSLKGTLNIISDNGTKIYLKFPIQNNIL